MTAHNALLAQAGQVVTVARLAVHAAHNTPPDADPPTIAYAAAELRNAAERIRMAITQLEGLRP